MNVERERTRLLLEQPRDTYRVLSPSSRLELAATAFLLFAIVSPLTSGDLRFLNNGRPVPDAHNCYPYDGRWSDRIDRALEAGFPISIEQDLAWFVDPATGKGRVVLSHSAEAAASDPELRMYFFEKVRPIVERALTSGDSSHWPLIVLHFDFKDEHEALLRAVWDLLGEYQGWITTAAKSQSPQDLTSYDRKPILVITEDSDAQARVFYAEQPVGSRLRLFGSAHTHLPATKDQKEANYLAATLPPDQLLPDGPTTYRRWWNNSWHEVEQGGQPNAGDWTPAKVGRLRALVDHAHQLGYWIRFYTLDGFSSEEGHLNGWFEEYNFGSLGAVKQRWQAALDACVESVFPVSEQEAVGRDGCQAIGIDEVQAAAVFARAPGPTGAAGRVAGSKMCGNCYCTCTQGLAVSENLHLRDSGDGNNNAKLRVIAGDRAFLHYPHSPLAGSNAGTAEPLQFRNAPGMVEMGV